MTTVTKDCVHLLTALSLFLNKLLFMQLKIVQSVKAHVEHGIKRYNFPLDTIFLESCISPYIHSGFFFTVCTRTFD
jgi:hypothetical protein